MYLYHFYKDGNGKRKRKDLFIKQKNGYTFLERNCSYLKIESLYILSLLIGDPCSRRLVYVSMFSVESEDCFTMLGH